MEYRAYLQTGVYSPGTSPNSKHTPLPPLANHFGKICLLWIYILREKKIGELPPHIFAIGDNCYSLMKRTR